jgi:hypothetical protein
MSKLSYRAFHAGIHLEIEDVLDYCITDTDRELVKGTYNMSEAVARLRKIMHLMVWPEFDVYATIFEVVVTGLGDAWISDVIDELIERLLAEVDFYEVAGLI